MDLTIARANDYDFLILELQRKIALVKAGILVYT
jgi:hypothetical protein